MDSGIACWILEFVLRQPVDDWVAHEILQAIPLPASAATDARLKKTILLRRIAAHLSNRAISEATLDSLEFIEELDHTEGKPTIQSLRDAYSAVATECTLSHLRGKEKCVDLGDFFDAVNRIWKFRIAKAATWGVTRLVSAELKIRRKEMETAAVDMDARCRLLRENEKGNAMKALGLYLVDALQDMGPPFLEMVAKKDLKKKFSDLKVENKCNTMPVGANRGTGTMDSEDHLLELGKRRSAGIQGLETENAVREHHLMVDQFTHEEVSDDGAGPGPRPMNLDASDLQLDRHETSEVREAGLETSRRLDSDNEAAKIGVSPPHVMVDQFIHVEVTDDEAGAGPIKLVGSGLQLDKRGTSQVLEVGLETRRRLNSDSSKQAEYASEYDRLPSPDVSKVREALKSSCADLQAAVNDPLPRAIDMAAEILINVNNLVMSTKQLDCPKHGGGNDPGVLNKIPTASGLDGNVAGSSLRVDGNEKARSSIMDRNLTAHTYEWDDDSIESASERSPNASKKIQLPSSKKRRVSPLKIHQVAKCARRRKIKRWTVLEEDTLREAVERHGIGNWKFILNCYSSVFVDRTEVDLKDKWRNMIRQ